MRWLSAFLILAVTLAGCTQDPEQGQSVDPGQEPGGDGNQTAPPGNATQDGNGTNQAPLANLTADVLNGTAPLRVNLTINGTDADGDMLSWTLSNGTGNSTHNGTLANGTTLPATLNFTLKAGNHTFVLTISDGNATTTANLTIEVVAAEGDPEADPNAPEDRGWYVFDPATSMCHVKAYEDINGLGKLYKSALGGGEWYIAEDNDVPGLQIENNHPLADAGSLPVIGGWGQDIPDCKDGDQVVQ